MILKYAIALAILTMLAAVYLRLRPGKGFAHIFSLWLHWGRLAALRRSGRIRPSPPLWYRTAYPAQSTCSIRKASAALRLHSAGFRSTAARRRRGADCLSGHDLVLLPGLSRLHPGKRAAPSHRAGHRSASPRPATRWPELLAG
jgi:hypothetical protein